MLPFSEGDGGLPTEAEAPKTFIWSNYNDFTPPISARGVANWKGHPFISETSWLVKYYYLARNLQAEVLLYEYVPCLSPTRTFEELYFHTSPKEMEIAPENQSLKTLKINHWTIEYHLSDLFFERQKVNYPKNPLSDPPRGLSLYRCIGPQIATT